MESRTRWLLPEGIEEVLPPEAWRLELLSRRVFDLYRSWGYELILPPIIEYLDSLLTGTGNDLDLQTFKLTDQLSGRLMGVRADMTPQAARIDAHRLKRDVPVRLCYLGTVLHTRPEEAGGTRSPLQVGAELFGHDGLESDLEVLQLMLETLALADVTNVHIDIGHVGIFRGLARQAGLTPDQEQSLFDALQRKATSEIGDLLAEYRIAETQSERFQQLAALHGGMEVFSKARVALKGCSSETLSALDGLESIATVLSERATGVSVYVDLAELRGYGYHTGVVFGAFIPGYGGEIARGGRYNDVGRVFGRARPATGFSTDLKVLMKVAGRTAGDNEGAVFAPAVEDAALDAAVGDLRANGTAVIRELPGQPGGAEAMGCDRKLVRKKGEWAVVPAGGK